MQALQSSQINELAGALAKAQGAMTTVEKDRTNPHFGAKYATLASVLGVVRPALSENGICIVQITETDERNAITLITKLIHTSGQFIGCTYPVQPVKNDPQGVGSALTYARRYSLMALTGVSPAEDDDDGNDASTKTRTGDRTSGTSERTGGAPGNTGGSTAPKPASEKQIQLYNNLGEKHYKDAWVTKSAELVKAANHDATAPEQLTSKQISALIDGITAKINGVGKDAPAGNGSGK